MPKHESRPILLAASLGFAFVGYAVLQRLREADLTGQVALVTGSSRGLGFLLARELLGRGCKVAICARDEQELERARIELQEYGEVMAVPCDVSQRTDVEQMIQQITQRFGRIDILVNNAGVVQVGPIQTMNVEDFESAMDTMFWGTVYPTLTILPAMLERHSGRIVNITSIGGKVSVPHLIPYSSAKFAAVAFSEGLRAELLEQGITVTTVAPGLMRTGSYLNTQVKGDHKAEYAWFTVADNMPFISIDAEQAAQRIVQAASRGDAELILTFPSKLLARFHGLFPGITTNILSLVNRLILPKGTNPTTEQGRESEHELDSPLWKFLTGWGRSAAERFNQHPGPSPQYVEQPGEVHTPQEDTRNPIVL